MEQVTQIRKPFIDNLRVFAMLLGIVFHCALAFVVYTRNTWSVHLGHPQFGYDILVLFLHTFRMPLFFLVAGFAASGLYQNRGAGGFARNRLQRIGLPLCFGMVYIGLFNALGGLDYFWFLYDLFLFYGVFLATHWLGHRLFPLAWKGVWPRVSEYLLTSLSALAGWVLVTWGVLIYVHSWTVATDAHYLPSVVLLFYYYLFFVVGTVLHQQSKCFTGRRGRGWVLVSIAMLIFFPGYVFLFRRHMILHQDSGLNEAMLLYALTSCFLVWGLVQLFKEYGNRHTLISSYLARISYWAYLSQFVFVTFVQQLSEHWTVSSEARFIMVIVLSFVLIVLSYELLVKKTWLGRLLNG